MMKKMTALMTAGMVTISTLIGGFAASVPVSADAYDWLDLFGDIYEADRAMDEYGLSEDEKDAAWGLGILGALGGMYMDATYEPEWLSTINLSSDDIGYDGKWWNSHSSGIENFYYYLPSTWDSVEVTADQAETGITGILGEANQNGVNGIIIYSLKMSDVNNITDLARKFHSSDEYVVNGVRRVNDLTAVDLDMKGIMDGKLAPAFAFQTPHAAGWVTLVVGFYANTETDRSTVIRALCTFCAA